ncbi:DUF1758 domain-containing protein [Trichonephila clavipes]|nr:DUF1758 domain-containing protein [Trichonephila clavipes]
MRTWRNLGGRANLASFLETKLETDLATILASLATMLNVENGREEVENFAPSIQMSASLSREEICQISSSSSMAIVVKPFCRSSVVVERKIFLISFNLDKLLSHLATFNGREQKKEDLRRIASELELCVSDKLTVLDFMDLTKNCDRYKNDPDSVHELANLIIEERKYDESQQLELEKIREKSKLDLEIARIRANDKDNNTEVNCNDSSSLDSLIKSIRTLTVKISDKPEGWSFFFLSLERAFAAKSVTDKFKPEILLNLSGEKAANIIIYLKDEDVKNFHKIKSIILQKFEPTPQSCLENFKKATRQNCESHVQFAS